MTPDRRGRPFTVLIVCTGNVCRSPAAELLFRAGLGDGSGVEVHSAGVRALVGEAVAEPTGRLLRERGIDPTPHRGRQLDADMVRAADLVLTMTAEQRSAVVQRSPAAVRRTFMLREFADLMELVRAPFPLVPAFGAAERLALLAGAVPGARALRAGDALDDIEDPYGRPDAVHAAVLDDIDRAVAAILGALGGTSVAAASDVTVSDLAFRSGAPLPAAFE